jgi:hypothetical protein
MGHEDEGVFAPVYELRIRPASGSTDWVSEQEFRRDPPLEEGDYLALAQMLREIANEIEGQHTPVRREPGIDPLEHDAPGWNDVGHPGP